MADLPPPPIGGPPSGGPGASPFPPPGAPPGPEPGTDDTATGGAPPPPDYSKVINLAEVLPEDVLKAIGQRVIDNKERDRTSAEKYRKNQARHLALFAGEVPGKNELMKNVTYIHMPYLTKATLMFHSKLHRHFFPATGDICGVVATRPDQRQKARKMSRHLNMFIRKRCPEYIPSHDRGGMRVLLMGSEFSVWYYDPVERRPKFEFCNTDDVILPYTHKSDRVDLADVPRITWRKYYQRHQLEAMSDPDPETGSAYYTNIDKLFPEPYDKAGAASSAGAGESKKDEKPVELTADRLMGTKPADDDPDAPREVVEQDLWLALPTERRQRPVTVCVDAATGTVLRLALREKDDPKDAARYKHELFANQAEFEAKMAAYQQQLLRFQNGEYDQGPPDPTTGMPTPVPLGHPGAPPMPAAEPAKPRQVPWNRFSHYVCLPNPEGIYGYGLGYLIEGHNIAADEVMSLYVSLMRMNLIPTYVYSRQAKMPRGELKLVLGEGLETPLPPSRCKRPSFSSNSRRGIRTRSRSRSARTRPSSRSRPTTSWAARLGSAARPRLRPRSGPRTPPTPSR
jgi:hypothetical protein